MSEWKEYKLGELYEVHNGLSKGREFFGSGYPFLTFPNVFNNWFLPEKLESLVQSSEKERQACSIRKGDVFITRTSETLDELGMSSVALKDYPNATYNGFTKRLRPITDKVLPEYIGYYLRSKKFRSKFRAFSTMTTRASLANNDLLSMEVVLPDIDAQRCIASFLSSLDDKIAVNRKICRNLEAQAQALFKHWFVDFAPFKDGKFVESELGLIPEGWRVGTLSDVLDLIKETTNQGERPELPYLPIDSIPMNSFLLNEVKENSEAQSSLLLFKKDDILVGAMRVYFHRVVPAPFDGITRSTCFVLRPKCDDYFSFALCVVNSNDAIRYAQKTSKGSTMPYAVWDGGLGFYCTLIPQKSILKDFNLLLKNDIEQIQNMSFENNRLATLRDTLLPKLMSGEISLE